MTNDERRVCCAVQSGSRRLRSYAKPLLPVPPSSSRAEWHAAAMGPTGVAAWRKPAAPSEAGAKWTVGAESFAA